MPGGLRPRPRNFFRGALLPAFLFSAPASALLWGILYQPLGYLNYLTQELFGITVNYLRDTRYALFAVLTSFKPIQEVFSIPSRSLF